MVVVTFRTVSLKLDGGEHKSRIDSSLLRQFDDDDDLFRSENSIFFAINNCWKLASRSRNDESADEEDSLTTGLDVVVDDTGAGFRLKYSLIFSHTDRSLSSRKV